MAITLTGGEHDEIRLLISSNIDEEDLDDAEIDADTVLGAAEGYVLRFIPNGTTGLNTAETKAYRRIVKYRCAWLLVPSFPEQTAETEGPFSARYQGTSTKDRRDLLHEQVNDEIQKLVDAGKGADTDEFTPAVAVFTLN